MSSPFHDRRASSLLSRVRDDIGHLRKDLRSLLHHTTRTTLPRGVREVADSARDQLAAGTSYAASRIRTLRSSPSAPAAGWIGGALLVGLLAAGAYALYRCQCDAAAEDEEYGEEEAVE